MDTLPKADLKKKVTEKNQQHQQLKDVLETQETQVKVMPIILGSTRDILDISTDGLEQSGIDRTCRETLNKKFHHDAITWMHVIVEKRRVLDAAFFKLDLETENTGLKSILPTTNGGHAIPYRA